MIEPLNLPVEDGLTDTHCHLFRDYFSDLDDVIDRARIAGVGKMLVAGYDIPTSIEAIELSLAYDFIVPAVGVHPTFEFEDPAIAAMSVENLIRNDRSRIAAIGETGIDLYHSKEKEAEQCELFACHLELARRFDKPVIIHSRNSAAQVVDVLTRSGYRGRGIFHCYDGSDELLDYARALGFGVSFAGNVTYPNAARLREMLALAPDELVLVETDSPFLSPVPKRGRRNEPANVEYVLAAVAQVKGWSRVEAAKFVYDNFCRILAGRELRNGERNGCEKG